VDLEEAADALERAADAMMEANRRYERAEAAWERLSLIEEAKIATDPEKYGKTSERTRRGLVLKVLQESPEYLEYIEARIQIKALRSRYNALTERKSTLQTLAKVMA
jgi:hypothetical protein